MAFPNDVLQTPAGNTALQSVSLLFNATGLAVGALRPPSKVVMGTPPPGALGTVPGSATMLDALTIDVTLSEVHTMNSDITEHPMEEGADVTDHVRPKPVELRMEGLITETPIDDSLLAAAIRAAPVLGIAAGAVTAVSSLLKGTSLSKTAFDKLRGFRDNVTLLSIFTPYRSYSKMVLETLVINRDHDEALKFTATFRELTFVSSGITSITLPPVAQSALDMGSQGVAAASSKVSQAASQLYKAGNAATGGGLDMFKTWVSQ